MKQARMDTMNSEPVGDLRGSFLEAMSRAANSVYIVTTDGVAGRGGVTVTAFSSVSADVSEPRLLICMHHESSTAQLIRANGVFCVNILSAAHEELSERFAGRRGKGEDRFAEGNWTRASSGLLRLEDALASYDCRLSEQSLVGTHHVLFGAVQDVVLGPDATPLLHTRRGYGQVAEG
ncbi:MULTISPECIES: flavin reductase family protein [Lentibacter]|jgi:flavin reductase|uniref:Flavin reductase n=1 Tax=Lentibacter algarum TaxID=576131 RepID=A0A1H3LQN9_9RHOB|nr:flavin reductase family protein [Lentibacter algarum]MCO4777106.1 flavin reductase family protein [Lentibacter algarum]MCO4827688.1 flavin reductase family protein [Lentibacter algarum]WIF32653.1 putative nitrilotriacetate monooxygenase component B [Lentibacter algarum]SDY66324.1 flavin reductase [Lentibacter algarum]